MIAGPSEVCCVADGSADPTWIAADLLSQAEHDPRAAVFLITPDADFGKKVEAEMERQMKELSRYEIMKSSVDDYAKAFLCKDAAQCFDIVNKIAPEHLEVELPDPKQYLPLIYNAGAISWGNTPPNRSATIWQARTTRSRPPVPPLSPRRSVFMISSSTAA